MSGTSLIPLDPLEVWGGGIRDHLWCGKLRKNEWIELEADGEIGESRDDSWNCDIKEDSG